jgi:putative ABC transport system permease protein
VSGIINWVFQIFVVTALNLRTIRQRLSSSIVAIVGIAGVVAVFVAVLSMAEGFRNTMATTGSPESAIVMRSGADGEMTSILTRADANIVGDAPGVRRIAAGPVTSPELFVIVDLPKRTTNTTANVPLRGVGAMVLAVRDNVKIVSGRMFETGRNELVVGRAAAAQFSGTDVGRTLKFGQNEWKIVGRFDAGGTVSDSELWCDAAVLAPAYQRGSSFQTVFVKLESAASFVRFKDALTTDPRLNLKVVRETEYYAEQSQLIYNLITTIGTLIAVLMGIGAVFGAVNTMYSAVAARTREIATLRAIGFGSVPVVISVLAESLALAVVGGVAGGAIAYLGFNGFETSTLNWQSFSQIGFSFTVTPALMLSGVFYAVVMGMLGGILPAIRAARLPIVAALREL